MKTASEEYAFTKSELQILKEIAKGKHELSSIKDALSIKPSLLSYNLKKLLSKGLIKTTGRGYRKQVYFNDSKHAILYRTLLLSYNHIDWQNILTGKAIKILFQTLTKSGKTLSKFPKNTRWRHLKNLKARGIITQDKKEYSINPRFSILTDFLNEYQKFLANKLAKTISENSIILWQEDMEFLIRAPKTAKPPSKFLKTATSIFNEYDLPLISDFDIYFYSTDKDTIRPEDAVLHTLLIEPNNVRYTTYALLLLKKTEKKIDKTYLLQEAEKLGLKNEVTSMLQFLKNHVQLKDQALPTWQEFVTKARDYNLVIE